jgi:hypothetical protein
LSIDFFIASQSVFHPFLSNNSFGIQWIVGYSLIVHHNQIAELTLLFGKGGVKGGAGAFEKGGTGVKNLRQ